MNRSLGIQNLQISINVYCDASHELEGQPGLNISFICKLELYNIDNDFMVVCFIPWDVKGVYQAIVYW